MARFSLPLNTKLPEDFVLNTFIPFLKEHKDYIYDIYFTCRMPPFVQDAMGDVIDGDMRDTTLNALYVSQETGIPLSATFNNIQVPPTQENLIFLLKILDSCMTQSSYHYYPHTSWVLTGQLQSAELFIKNIFLEKLLDLMKL